MREFFSSEIVQGVLATLAVVVILGVLGWFKFKRDEKIVIEFLKNSGVQTGEASSTTTTISSGTELSEARIRRVCTRSARICKGGKEKGSWTLS